MEASMYEIHVKTEIGMAMHEICSKSKIKTPNDVSDVVLLLLGVYLEVYLETPNRTSAMEFFSENN